MSARPRVLLLFASIAIAVAAYVWSRPVATIEPAPVVAVTAPSPKAPEQPIEPANIATGPVVAAEPIDRALATGYSTSTNYREFIALAKRDVAHGGGAYAIAAEVECDYVKAVLDAVNRGPKEAATDSRNIVARAEARTLLEARCGTLMQTEVGGRTFFELKRSGEDRLDPLLQLRNQLHDPRFRTDRTFRNDFVARVVQTQDPLMWTQYRSVLIEGDPVKGTAYFDGVTYADKDYHALVAAMELVPCAMGFDCARLDTNVAVTCLQHHVCEHDRFELEKLKATARGYEFSRVLALQDALVTALKTSRVAAFIRP